jgi:periplasmic copper chaperone A
MLNRRQSLLLGLSALAFSTHAHQIHGGNDVQAITHVMKRQFDRPEAPLTVHPVTILGDAAVAGWSQDGKGGRALLRKEKAAWSIHVCAGKGLTQSDVLAMTGLSKNVATELAQRVVKAEANLTAQQRALFDSFEGMLNVGGPGAPVHGAHGSHAPHGHPAPKSHKAH